MTAVSKAKVGMVEESTYGLRAIPTEFRLFGNYLAKYKMDFPNEIVNPLIKMLSSSFLPSQIEYNEISVEFTIPFQLIDPQVLSYIVATATSSDTTSGDPRYRHLVKPILPSSAFTLPSQTIHIEIYDSSEAWLNSIDVCGCKIKKIKVSHVYGDPDGTIVYITFIGQRVVDSNPTSNLLGATTGATADPEGVQGQYYANRLTNANRGSLPARTDSDSLTYKLRAGTGYQTNPQPFHVNKTISNAINVGGTIQLTTNTATTYGTITAGGTDLTSFYKGFEFTLDVNYKESRPIRSGYNNYGASISPYLMNALIDNISMGLVISLDLDTTTYALMLNTLKKTKTNSLFIRIEKFNDSTDWVDFCFAPSSGSAENVFLSLEDDFPFIAQTGDYKLMITPKDLHMVIGNDFATLRSMT